VAASNAKYYSGISDPQPTLDSLRSVAQSLKNNLEVLTQQKDPLAAAAVTFQDLLDVGLLASISPVGIMKGVILESLKIQNGDTEVTHLSSTGIRTTGVILSSGPKSGVGYTVGAGGVVSQGAGSGKATGVTLNTMSGHIMMDGAALGAGAAVSFTLTNSEIAMIDTPIVVIKSGATVNSYDVAVTAMANGSCRIQLRNFTAGSLSETVALGFAVFKGAVT